MVINALRQSGCEEVVLEAEVTNTGALRLYQRLGFIRDKRLKRHVGLGLVGRREEREGPRLERALCRGVGDWEWEGVTPAPTPPLVTSAELVAGRCVADAQLAVAETRFSSCTTPLFHLLSPPLHAQVLPEWE